MTLKQWLNENKWLKAYIPSKDETANLFEVVKRCLNDASVDKISLDARLSFAYQAALVCADIALRASGYRADKGAGHHEHTINSMRFTIKLDSDSIKLLHSFRKKRGLLMYDLALGVSEVEFKDALKLAKKKHHSELID